MTQTVSSSWTENIDIRTLYFLDPVDPPKNLDRDEFFSLLRRLAETETPAALLEEGWLHQDEDALASVRRGLSQVGSIDRGSFAVYARHE